MTWAVKPSDKAVTANSESSFSVGELTSKVIIKGWPELPKKQDTKPLNKSWVLEMLLG